MPLPAYQEIMRPLLEYLAREGKSVKFFDLCEGLAEYFPQMTREEFEEDRHATGQRRFLNRAGWAALELKHAMLTRSPKYGYHEITQRGKDAIANKEVEIDRNYLLERYPEFREYVKKSKNSQKYKQSKTIISNNERDLGEETDTQDDDKTLDEKIYAIVEENNNILEKEILEEVRRIKPKRFEQLVVELLLKMGYGVSGEAIGGRGDGGIDGVINQDKLGVDRIYIQAKRYNEDANVTPNQVREFSGALNRGIGKGIFFTTSSFTRQAEEEAEKAEKHIILIDGKELSRLMVQHDVGCTSKKIFVKEIEKDFFE